MCHMRENPYVGPQPFTAEDWEYFFGRKYEAADLHSLICANRLVLFYAPSGAGKSSLINTSLRRSLHAEGFTVLPVVRVSGDPPDNQSAIDNIYAFNVMANLARELPSQAAMPAELAHLRLCDYLSSLLTVTPEQGMPERAATADAMPSGTPNTHAHVLVIDQFEEIFTTHPEAWNKREDFFRQLAEALNRDEQLWLLLAMREEYVAALDRYAMVLPGRLRTRYYMPSLNQTAALEAIEEPAKKGQRPFEPGVAQALVDSLSRVQVRENGLTAHPGEFVEPVQLQVVCYELWEALKADRRPTIRREDLQRIAQGKGLEEFVDTALARFYEKALAETITATSVAELAVRNWFEEELITEAGTRNLVFRGVTQTGGLPNKVVDGLAKRLLIHPVQRPGGTWYELIHDRLIEPIFEANQAWFQKQPLLLLAQEWAADGRSERKLLEGSQLEEALHSNWTSLGSLVQAFLEASQTRQQQTLQQERARQQALELQHTQALVEEQRQRAEEQAHANTLLRQGRRWLILANAMAIILLLAALVAYQYARQQTNAAVSAQVVARSAARQTQLQLSRWLAAEALRTVPEQPQSSLLLAAEAVALSTQLQGEPIPETRVALEQVLNQTVGIALRDSDEQMINDATVLALSHDGRRLAAGSRDGRVYLWELTDDPLVTAVATQQIHTEAMTSMAFSHDDHWLATGGRDNTVQLIDLTAPDPMAATVTLTGHRAEITTVAFTPNNRWLATGSADQTVHLFDLARQAVVTDFITLPEEAGISKVLFSPDGRWLATITVSDTLRLWNIAAANPAIEPQELSRDKDGLIAFSPGGKWLAVASNKSDMVQLYAMTNAAPPFAGGRLPTQGANVYALDFDAHEQWLAVGSDDGHVRLWELQAIVPQLPQTPALPPIASRTEAQASALMVYPALTEPAPQLLRGHTGAVTALAFDPTGERLATGGNDHAIRWFALTSDQGIEGGYSTDGTVQVVLWGPQKEIFTANSDGSLRLWKPLAPPTNPATLPVADLVQLACLRAGRDFHEAEKGQFFNDTHYHSVCAEIPGL